MARNGATPHVSPKISLLLHLSIRLSGSGIEPVSVGVVVSVKDALAIEFTVVAGV